MSAFKMKNETIADGFYACPAVYEDAESITGLLVRTAEWLRDRGSNQWSGLLKGQDTHDITGSIENGHVFVFKKDEELAAVVMLLPEPSEWDRTLWGDDGHEESIYLHRLAVSRRFAGQGLGARVLHWVETGIYFPGKHGSGLIVSLITMPCIPFIGVWDMNSWVLMHPGIICLRKRFRQNKRPLQEAFLSFSKKEDRRCCGQFYL